MRRLARTVGVEAMSLYNHVGSKDDLLDGLVDLVFEEIEPPPSGVDWRTAMRRRAISTREALRRHPWAIGLMEARSKPGPASIALHEAVLKTLREAGFSLAETVHAYSVQDAYIYGFALQERALPSSLETPEGGAEVAARQMSRAVGRRVPVHLRDGRRAHRDVRLRLHGRVRVRARPHPRRPRAAPRRRLTPCGASGRAAGGSGQVARERRRQPGGAPVVAGDRLDHEARVLAVERQRRDLVGVRRPLDDAPVERQRRHAGGAREAAREALGERPSGRTR